MKILVSIRDVSTVLELGGTCWEWPAVGLDFESALVRIGGRVLASVHERHDCMTEIEFDSRENDFIRIRCELTSPSPNKRAFAISACIHDDGSVSMSGKDIRKCIASGMIHLALRDVDPAHMYELHVAKLKRSHVCANKHYLLNKVPVHLN